MIIPYDQFSFENNRFVAEASDLIGYGFRNKIPNMFDIKGLKRTESFRFDHVVTNADGDVEVVVFVPIDMNLFRQGVEVHILND